MTLTEPAVTLTDYALAIECVAIVLLLMRGDAGDRTCRFWFVVFFASAAAASLLGGTVHGFFPDTANETRQILWKATLLAILVTSLAGWNIGATILFSGRGATVVRGLAGVQLVLLALIVLFVRPEFLMAIVAYVPATLFLLIALIAAYRSRRLPPLRWGIIGLGLTFVAAAVQRLHLSVHPYYFNHNALYHVIQGVALWMIFLGARSISTARPPIRRMHAIPT
ncbi:MAG TPA: hypothetical protein VGO33_10065 [Gemmatimonadaceae bacterium]|jgi:hypothetical protein|nr:hypothetical protein [Gemmatimonadaceae bacterium]